MDRRFFCAPVDGDTTTLEGAEAHHLLHVLRAREGDEVVLFDGSGREFLARISSIRKQQVQLRIVSWQEVDRELPFQLHVGVALPKGDRQKWLVEKAVELGVTSLTPLESRRGVALPGESALERLRRYVIEACKQSGRNRLLDVRTACPLSEFTRHAPAAAQRWFADPRGAALDAGAVAQARRADDLWVAIGPEGGWTDDEWQAALDASWRGVSLGPRILRIETALCAVAALVGIGRD